MYWYKRYFLFIAGLTVFAGIQSCKSDSNAGSDTKQFFDLKKYFTSESIRLTKINPLITKTAVHNSVNETKKLHIANWETELSLFIASDINKPAWRASYTSSSSEGITTYTATDSALKTRSIVIKKQNDKVKLILIYNNTKTTLLGKALYWTTEELSYVPDSMYRIQKKQYVRMRGFNNYYIRGLFNQ